MAVLAATAALSAAGLSPALARDLPACAEGSSGLVLSVTPLSNAATLQRGGASGPLTDLALLCPGDLIVLNAGESALIEVQGERSPDEPLEGPTEYQVPAAPGMLDNASFAVARLLFPEASTRTRTLVSRSDGATMSPRPENLGVRLPQELASSAEPRALWFGWSGGVAPFHVTLEDSAGAVLAGADLSDAEAAALRAQHTAASGVVAEVPYDVTFAALVLPAGDYRLRVADANSEPPEVASLMSDEDAGIMSMPLAVIDGLAGVPSRTPEGVAKTDLDRIVEAMCFALGEPENRLFEAAQHVVEGRNGAPYRTSLALLGSDIGQADREAICQ
jgi:hypothetical protein